MGSKLLCGRSGFAELYMDAHQLLREGLVSADAPALDLSGCVLKTYADIQFLKKFLALFQPVSLRLANCGLKGNLAWIGGFLFTWERNAIVDLADNPIQQHNMVERLAILQTKVEMTRNSYFIAIGEEYPALLSFSATGCHPRRGCLCERPRLHVTTGVRYFDVITHPVGSRCNRL